VALIVFSDCGKIDVVQPFTTQKNKVESKIDQILPDGSTPLAEALEFAKEYQNNAHSSERTIVMFTDGIETCR
jgi:Mg-chelatase subunit ChlD